MTIDYKAALRFANAALTAAKGGVSLNIKDSNAMGQYVFSIFSIGADLVPVVGPAFGTLVALIGQAALPSNSDPNALWNSLREKVENLIGAKIQAHQVHVLKSKIDGFASNMEAFTRVWNDYEKVTGDSKAKQAETLRTHHIAFLAVLRAGIPEFQVEDSSVAALPLFAQAANIHLTLLVDGIRHGVEWGFTSDYVKDNLKQEFSELTGSAKKSRSLNARYRREEKSNLDLLQDAIKVGEDAGWPAELLDTWRVAHDVLAKPTALAKRAAINYPTYAKDTYEKGRKLVKPYELGNYHGTGVGEALLFNALSDYDSTMIKNVLTYAEFWPYISGEVPMPDSAKKALDREIFSGPYGRFTEGATWDASKAPPVTQRGANITAVRVRGYDDIDALQVQYGGSWGPLFGNPDGGVESLANLAFDEYIQSIDTHYGFKLGQLTFFSNTNKTYGPYGRGKNSQRTLLVEHEGFGLTSMYITRWAYPTPTGCEGIIFGFRPLLSSWA